jgi:hypothetical protein
MSTVAAFLEMTFKIAGAFSDGLLRHAKLNNPPQYKLWVKQRWDSLNSVYGLWSPQHEEFRAFLNSLPQTDWELMERLTAFAARPARRVSTRAPSRRPQTLRAQPPRQLKAAPVAQPPRVDPARFYSNDPSMNAVLRFIDERGLWSASAQETRSNIKAHAGELLAAFSKLTKAATSKRLPGRPPTHEYSDKTILEIRAKWNTEYTTRGGTFDGQGKRTDQIRVPDEWWRKTFFAYKPHFEGLDWEGMRRLVQRTQIKRA